MLWLPVVYMYYVLFILYIACNRNISTELNLIDLEGCRLSLSKICWMFFGSLGKLGVQIVLAISKKQLAIRKLDKTVWTYSTWEGMPFKGIRGGSKHSGRQVVKRFHFRRINRRENAKLHKSKVRAWCAPGCRVADPGWLDPDPTLEKKSDADPT